MKWSFQQKHFVVPSKQREEKEKEGQRLLNQKYDLHVGELTNENVDHRNHHFVEISSLSRHAPKAGDW